jgi:hypothetical protein
MDYGPQDVQQGHQKLLIEADIDDPVTGYSHGEIRSGATKDPEAK